MLDDDYIPESYELNCGCIMCGAKHHCTDDCHLHRSDIEICFCGQCFYGRIWVDDDDSRYNNTKIIREGSREEIEALLALLWIAK